MFVLDHFSVGGSSTPFACFISSNFEPCLRAFALTFVWSLSHRNPVDFQWLACCFEHQNQRGVTLSPLVLFTSIFGLTKEPLFACFQAMFQAIFDGVQDLHRLCPEPIISFWVSILHVQSNPLYSLSKEPIILACIDHVSVVFLGFIWHVIPLDFAGLVTS